MAENIEQEVANPAYNREIRVLFREIQAPNVLQRNCKHQTGR